MKGINDLEYTLIKICERRGKVLQKVESVAFNVLLSNGLANPTSLLPAVANTFYYCVELTLGFALAAAAGSPLIQLLPNAGVASVGTPSLVITNNVNVFTWHGIECDSMVYAGGITGGAFGICGTVFKITHTA